MRIYDKESQFDKIIDFAYFEDFNDKFFGLKFFLKNKKAEIRIEDFFNYYLEQNKLTNVSLTESFLDLSSEEVAYIYKFISTLHKALPKYSYDFDILTNNSETHISQILHDCYRTIGNTNTNDRYLFSNVTKHTLKFKRINDSFVQLVEKENLNLGDDSIKSYSPEQKNLLIILIAISSIFFLVTVYQVLVYFFEKIYIVSIFKSIQVFDFTILFANGLSGLFIIFMDLFSNQAMLRNNFDFLYLFPLNIIAAFSIFKTITTRKKQIIYWSLVSFLSCVYILIVSILESRIPLVNLFFVIPIFLRTIYFDFLAIDVKKKNRA